MLTDKQLKAFVRRFKKANSTLSVMGMMMLDIEIDLMPLEEMEQLQSAMFFAGIPASSRLASKILKQRALSAEQVSV